jgi:outer membrane protein OmpA-like peptidoglycan-associated protein
LGTIKTYYKGTLKCQFSTLKGEKIGSGIDVQSKFQLEPRYRLYDALEITESEYLAKIEESEQGFIKQEVVKENIFKKLKPLPLEFYFGNDKINGIKKDGETIVLFLNKKDDSIPIIVNDKPLFLWQDHLIHEEVFQFNKTFSALHPVENKDARNHGKIEGFAYCKISKYVNDPIEEHTTIVPGSDTLPTGCLSLLNPTSDNGGCLSLFMPPTNLGGGGGCLNMLNPFYWIRGIWRSGGCLGSLFYLALLLGLLWALFSGKCNKEQEHKVVEKEAIHDTVYVEVYKEKVDTLTIIKIDTVASIDSITTTNYEMVSLPNVQFKTNEDILLPTSAIELQKLAEYLIKNEELTAEILGHTDNVGDSKSNQILSQKRAESIKRFLVSLGVNGKRLAAIGKGDSQPKSSNDSEEGRLMNRRVEVRLLKTQSVKSETKVVDTKNKK